MIYSIKGNVSHIEQNTAIIECNNIGYKCFVSNNTFSKLSIGADTFLYTYMNVKDDGIDLYGFNTTDELKTFKILISISGVGPKAAMSILSEFDPYTLTLAVASNDYKRITKCQGIGTKTAQRIVLELKDKLKVDFASSDSMNPDEALVDFTQISSSAKEAISALKTLGYSEFEATNIIKKQNSNMSVEELIRLALKEL
jgi:Holliday junction DNA helicase RuvA